MPEIGTARCDPIVYPGDGTVVLRIRGDDEIATGIEWGWEQMLQLGSSLIEHALLAKREAVAPSNAEQR